MEDQKDMHGMLELMLQPAFFVRDGLITLVNQAAQHLLLEPGLPIASLLGNNLEEYRDFTEGCLCLTLLCAGCPMSASVTRIAGSDLFVLDQETDQPELKAMALTAAGIREPLSDIIAISEQLRPALEQSSDPLTDARINQMNRRLTQLHRVVCNMADAIHYAEEAIPRMSCRNICAVLDEIFDRAADLVSHAGFHLTYQGLDEPIDCLIAADRLERAVYNILSNTMKYAPAGTVIDARLQRRGNKLYLSIQDNGPGIPSHLMGSVYGRYRRYPSIESQPSGLGLGMVLVRGTAAVHGGAVLIDQPKGQGTRTTMSLSITRGKSELLRSEILTVDYAGERDHGLLELSDVLPPDLYQ